jgi:hypothetical protein
MFTFISQKDFNNLVNELLVLKSKLIKVTNEVHVLQTQVMELNLKRPVVLSSTSKASGSSITYTAKPKRGRPFGSTAKPKK